MHAQHRSVDGDELFLFGSNKNLTLGVGDEDDRQYPERIHLKRPDELLQRFYQSYLAQHDIEGPTSLPNIQDIPALVRDRHLVVQDVVMSKLHSAIITTDPVSNLYICGVGRGGRLGLGDENTQFRFVPVQGPIAGKKIREVALGQNHTMAVVGNGELWTWGLNSNSQLGYILPPPMKADEEPMSLLPRQVFGTLKKEIVLGVAASANHSVAHTGASLYCWGRNVGQLALMDADSRSLEIQYTPRRVAASLLAAPIEMVSAIDKATVCLLANHSVWVFSNYGYNLVKFPFPDVFTNHNLNASTYSNRYDPGRRDINYITSGGDTIAAVTARGDLFTMHLKADLNQPASSTTNPSKIKGALTQPQCIWDSRKDGVISVGIGEHGSVIICTESGAVWKRVKRTTRKVYGIAALSDVKRNDFKFQRVPYITNCVAVRSSIFGAFAAIRKDNRVMTEEVGISGQTIWDDVGSLLCLCDFVASAPLSNGKQARKSWEAAIVREKLGSVPHEILSSEDVETDLKHWLTANAFRYNDFDAEICTSSSPEIRIPIHCWALSARSPILRECLTVFHDLGSFEDETLTIKTTSERLLLTISNIDILTLLNIVVYAYQDKHIPVWKYTRESPTEAFRFRHVRTEVMKVASHLQMMKLEAAARLQTGVEPSLDVDLKEAISHPEFFDDGDFVIELEGAEVSAHSQLVCQRCPFFEGVFHGRSQGQWLAGRRDELDGTDKVRINLKHISPDTFDFVLEFLYADVGGEIFNDVTAATIDDFSEIVLEVMSVANELMLDRLSEICQSIIGKFVTTRNISLLLNEISPCSVTEFKDAGLEYICLQLESMLENHWLDNLDEDLLAELDEVVRDNQLARLPFVKSGRAELLLHEKYPDLAGDIDEERHFRLKEMAYKGAQRDDERKLSSSFKTRFGSIEDHVPSSSQTPDRVRRKSKPSRNEPFSPSLRPKKSQGDMIFDMDEEEGILTGSPESPTSMPPGSRVTVDTEDLPQLPKAWRESKGKATADPLQSPDTNAKIPTSLSPKFKTPKDKSPGPEALAGRGGSPWAAASPLPTAKLDLKNIMSETSSKSSLTARLEEQRNIEASGKKPQVKVSQKERKKQLQMQAAAQAAAEEELANRVAWDKQSTSKQSAPWKAAAPIPKASLKEAMAADANAPGPISAKAKPLVASETASGSTTRRTASPDTRFPGQSRTSSSPAVPSASSAELPKKPLVPHSRSYMTPASKAEPTIGLSMSDIIGQQEREQEMVKEAVAKRSLQEIQQEQAFQEWWDQESRRAQEEEARRKNKSKDDKGPRRGGRRGRGGKPRNNEAAAGDGGNQQAAAGAAASNSRNQGKPLATASSFSPSSSSRSKGVTKGVHKGKGTKT